jgi:hypothetical protein
VLVESPVTDETSTATTFARPAQRTGPPAEDNVADRLQRLGLIAPKGEVTRPSKPWLTISRSPIISTSSQKFVAGMTTTTSNHLRSAHHRAQPRLIEIWPKQASLATVLAHELSLVVLGHRMDSQYAFFDQLLVEDKDSFRHFGFARTPDEETAANAKAVELIANALKNPQLAKAWQMSNAALFLQALQDGSQTEFPT